MPKVYDKVTGSIKPKWHRIRLLSSENFAGVSKIIEQHALNTICSGGMCSNKAECRMNRTATLIIRGDICTCSCRFCAINTGKPLPLANSEPQKIAVSINLMGQGCCVAASLTCDDLYGTGILYRATTSKSIRKEVPKTNIEKLISGMGASVLPLKIALAIESDAAGHNKILPDTLEFIFRHRKAT